MPIRTKPIDLIGANDLDALVKRRTQEDATIDFKQDFSFLQAPSDSEKRHEFLKDVTAMANAYGGTIVYGVEEGSGAEKGVAKRLTPFMLPTSADDASNQIDGILGTGIDERITGVRHRGIVVQNQKHYWIVRVPPSHLAPHFVKRVCKKPKPNCYRRENTTNLPLDARGIKEIALRAATARERAQSCIEDRIQFSLRQGNRDYPHTEGDDPARLRPHVMLHAVSLFPGEFDIEQIDSRKPKARCPRFALEGLYFEQPGGGAPPEFHLLFLRRGGVEFQKYGICYRPDRAQHLLVVAPKPFLMELSDWVKELVDLTERELVRLPILVQASLVDVENTHLPVGYGEYSPLEHKVVRSESWVLDGVGEPAKEQVRRMINMLWQAYGLRDAPFDVEFPWDARTWGE